VDWDIFTGFAREFGFPCAALGVLALALWRVIRWVGREVFLPLVKRHIQFLDDLTRNNAEIAKAVSAVPAALQDDRAQHAKTHAKLDEVIESLPAVCRAECPAPASAATRATLPMPEVAQIRKGA
jgi:hypothetical protein